MSKHWITATNRLSYIRMDGFSSLSVADRLLTTNEDERRRPPRRLANVLRLSRTREMAPFQPSVSGRIVGNTSFCPSKPNFLKTFSKWRFGMQRIAAPQGMETNPRAREMPQSRPPMRVTWNAAPPTKTIRI